MDLQCFFLAVTIAVGALAGPKVEIIETAFLGSGCAVNTDVQIAPNAKRIDFYFGDFSLAAEDSAVNVATSECKAVVRVKIPYAFSVAVLRVKYRGAYQLPYGANAHLLALHSVNENELAHFTKRYNGFSNGTFAAEKTVEFGALDWTPCGEDVIFTAVTTIALSTKKSLPEGSFGVRGWTEKSGLTYYLAWRRCVPSV